MERLLNFVKADINKRKFHTFKQPVNLYPINANKIVMLAKVKHCEISFKYIAGYIDCAFVTPHVLSYLKWVFLGSDWKGPPSFFFEKISDPSPKLLLGTPVY